MNTRPSEFPTARTRTASAWRADLIPAINSWLAAIPADEYEAVTAGPGGAFVVVWDSEVSSTMATATEIERSVERNVQTYCERGLNN